MNFFPIIHIIGLPGAGKTTLAKKLSSRLNLPVLRIGECRSKYPPSPIGEADAWVAPPFSQTITVKLEAPRKILFFYAMRYALCDILR